jgi:hypothetical protein
MKIMDRVNLVRDAILAEQTAGGGNGPGTKGFKLKVAAIRATLGGIVSTDWEDYMTIFASNEDQLKRLTGRDASAPDAWVKETSAYIVSNGTCGGFTPLGLPQFLNPQIDDGLPEATDPAFQHHIEF